MTENHCGACAYCCRVLRIEEFDPPKPAGQWCPHARPGNAAGGCAIYKDRPNVCQKFACLWLLSQSRANPAERLAPELRPDRAKAMLTMTADGKHIGLVCPPRYPHAWKRGKLWVFIQELTARGHEIIVSANGVRHIIDQKLDDPRERA